MPCRYWAGTGPVLGQHVATIESVLGLFWAGTGPLKISHNALRREMVCLNWASTGPVQCPSTVLPVLGHYNSAYNGTIKANQYWASTGSLPLASMPLSTLSASTKPVLAQLSHVC